MVRKIAEWVSWGFGALVLVLNLTDITPDHLKVPAFVLALVLLGASLIMGVHAQGPEVAEIVGAWFVDAVAPYRPHLVTFIQTARNTGVLIFSNPSNVQDGPNASVKVTDSTGHGHWVVQGNKIIGTMWQENALQPERTRGPRLAVTFELEITGRTTFQGPAVAELIDPATGNVIEEQPSFLAGTRLTMRRSALARLRAGLVKG